MVGPRPLYERRGIEMGKELPNRERRLQIPKAEVNLQGRASGRWKRSMASPRTTIPL